MSDNPQDWAWEALSLFNSLFSYMPPFVITWDTTTRTIHHQKSQLKLYFWCLCQIINNGLLVCGSALYVIVKFALYEKSVRPLQAVAACGMLLIGSMHSNICRVHYIHKDEHVLGVNSLIYMHKKKIDAQEAETKKPKKPKSKKRAKKPVNVKQMIYGKTVKAMMWGFWLIPLIVPIAIFEGVDPWKVILRDLVPTYYLENYPLHVVICLFFLRLILGFIAAAEASRFLAAFFLLFISGIIIYIDLLDRILKLEDENGKRKYLNPHSFVEYKTCRILIQILSPILRREISCLMGVGFMIAVGGIIGVVQGFELFPWYMYAAFVFACCVTLIIIYFTLPFGTESNEKTAHAIVCWKYEAHRCSPVHAKHVRKILQSLRPISVNCGSYFKLQTDTKSTYFDSIFSTSCDLNISVDLREIFSFSNSKLPAVAAV